ncbi:MAG: TonB-dependent receptor [Pseudomonadota bacterium]
MQQPSTSLRPPATCHRPCSRGRCVGLRGPWAARTWLGVLVFLGMVATTVQAQALPEAADAAPMPLLAQAAQFDLLAQAEPDFFAEKTQLQVLSVTRLAQPLADTPGAVTVLDRQTLRRSGARNLTEALRLVPGYMVAGLNGANLVAAYHAPVDEYGVRSLILVDGRSLYSPSYMGGGFRALNAVPIEEVERIEVLRGSNSTAFGAHALFGVINVVTRHALDTLGQALSFTAGSGGVADAYARIGWGAPGLAQRLSVSRSADHGLRDLHDSHERVQLLWRADLKPSPGTELMLQAGLSELEAGHGFARNPTDPQRDVGLRTSHGLLQWSRAERPDATWKATLSWDEERLTDPIALNFSPRTAVVDLIYHERRLALELEHTRVMSPSWRWVLGAGVRDDSSFAPVLFATTERVGVRDWRVFGHAEWTPAPRWLLNAGLFAGYRSDTGSYLAPRLMLNHELAPGHTLRAGLTRAERPPLLFERSADVHAYSNGIRGPRFYRPTPELRNEVLRVQELGYHASLAEGRVNLDLRLYQERMGDFIQFRPGVPRQYVNAPGFTLRGLEYQLIWRPSERTELRLNQSFNQMQWHQAEAMGREPPARLSTVALFQRLDHGWDVALMLHEHNGMSWRPPASAVGSVTRVDARLARAFDWGGARAEAALVVQSLGGDIDEFVPNRHSNRRVYASLRLEF